MTPAIPPDAKRYVLAAVVPCAFDDPCSNGENLSAFGWPYCRDCNRDGTRTVVTDIEVEPRDATSGDTTVRVWLEVER